MRSMKHHDSRRHDPGRCERDKKKKKKKRSNKETGLGGKRREGRSVGYNWMVGSFAQHRRVVK